MWFGESTRLYILGGPAPSAEELEKQEEEVREKLKQRRERAVAAKLVQENKAKAKQDDIIKAWSEGLNISWHSI
jgi:hypothetical protein